MYGADCYLSVEGLTKSGERRLDGNSGMKQACLYEWHWLQTGFCVA